MRARATAPRPSRVTPAPPGRVSNSAQGGGGATAVSREGPTISTAAGAAPRASPRGARAGGRGAAGGAVDGVVPERADDQHRGRRRRLGQPADSQDGRAVGGVEVVEQDQDRGPPGSATHVLGDGGEERVPVPAGRGAGGAQPAEGL